MIEIVTADSRDDYDVIAKMARVIIPEVYYPIVPPQHVDQFLDKYQTVEAIEEQVSNTYTYFFLKYNTEIVGYLGISISEDILLLSKLYILKDYRGKGIGKAALGFIEGIALKQHCYKIELLANEYNLQSLEVYKHFGYSMHELIPHNFEDGLIVRDYRMEKIMKHN